MLPKKITLKEIHIEIGRVKGGGNKQPFLEICLSDLIHTIKELHLHCTSNDNKSQKNKQD
jgi:type VI protein secretion system component Hcp